MHGVFFFLFFAETPACIWVQGTAVIRLEDALFHVFFHLHVLHDACLEKCL